MPKILIVGGSGFVGAALQTRLDSLGLPYLCVNRNSEILDSESFIGILEETIKSNPRITKIFFLGSPTIQHEKLESLYREHYSEIIEFARILSGMSRRLTFFWTGSYWQDQDRFDAYTKNKRKIENKLQELAGDNLRVVCIHLGDAYGPNDSRNKLIPLLKLSLLNSTNIAIKQPKSLIIPTHVRDIQNGFQKLINLTDLEKLKNFEVFDLIGSQIKTVEQVIIICQQFFPDLKVSYENAKFETQKIKFSHRPIPGWQPEIPLEQGLIEVFSEKE